MCSGGPVQKQSVKIWSQSWDPLLWVSVSKGVRLASRLVVELSTWLGKAEAVQPVSGWIYLRTKKNKKYDKNVWNSTHWKPERVGDSFFVSDWFKALLQSKLAKTFWGLELPPQSRTFKSQSRTFNSRSRRLSQTVGLEVWTRSTVGLDGITADQNYFVCFTPCINSICIVKMVLIEL